MTIDFTLKWKPSHDTIEKSAMHRFHPQAKDYHDLWRWSVENKETFWSQVWDFCGIIGDKGKNTCQPGTKMQEGRFFPDSKINFAENLLRRRDDAVAMIFRGEDKVERSITFKQLYDQVSQLRQALQAEGVAAGDRVAGYLPNMPETIMAMLAATSLGAIWSSASPDFGVQGVLDRFGQIEPKILFAVDSYYYNGKEIDCRGKVKEVLTKMPSLKKTVIVQYCHSIK
jgi:acetoacetyl-CoA synthetase